MANQQEDPFAKIKDKLAGISEEEREIIEKLFVMTQEIEGMTKEEKEIAQEIEIIAQEINDLEKIIINEEILYKSKQGLLQQTLKSYQRMGPGSYLEIILDSNSLSDMLRRINTLRDLTRNTGELLEALDESSKKLAEEKKKIDEKLILMERQQQELQIALRKKTQLLEKQKDYLRSLGEERDYYQEHLSKIQEEWKEIQPLFAKALQEFGRIIKEEKLPLDTIKTTFTLMGIKGSIDEETLNNIIIDKTNLPDIAFRFHPGKIEIKLLQGNLVLSGKFIIVEGQKLKFVAEDGSFYGLLLTPAAIKELFRDGDIVLDLKPLLGKNTLHSVEVREGQLELMSRLTFF